MLNTAIKRFYTKKLLTSIWVLLVMFNSQILFAATDVILDVGTIIPNGVQICDSSGDYCAEITRNPASTANANFAATPRINGNGTNGYTGNPSTRFRRVDLDYDSTNSPLPFSFQTVNVNDIDSLTAGATYTNVRDAYAWSVTGEWTLATTGSIGAVVSVDVGGGTPITQNPSLGNDWVGDFIVGKTDPDLRNGADSNIVSNIGQFVVLPSGTSNVLLNMANTSGVSTSNNHNVQFKADAFTTQMTLYIFNSGQGGMAWSYTPSMVITLEDPIFGTITNVVDNTAGGSAVASDFLLSYTDGGINTDTLAGGITHANIPLAVGDFSFSANTLPFYVTTVACTGTAASVLTGSTNVTAPVGLTVQDGDIANCVYTHTYTPEVDFEITKTNNASSVSPGEQITYDIQVSNLGSLDTSGATVVDNFSSDFTGVSWTCAIDAGSTGVCGTPSGTGDINTTLDLNSGSSATYTVTATVASAASGTVANTATVAVPTGYVDNNIFGGANSATDTDTVLTSADLEIVKTASTLAPTQGVDFQYTVTVTNHGPSDATNVVVEDRTSQNQLRLQNVVSISTGTVSGTDDTSAPSSPPQDRQLATWTLDIAAGATETMVLNARHFNPAPRTNTAEIISFGPAGLVDPDLTNNIYTVETDPGANFADLYITKTDNTESAVPGTSLTYELVVGSQAGSLPAIGATVFDAFDPAIFDLAAISWTCALTTGTNSLCNTASGTGNLNTLVDLYENEELTFTITAPILSSATGTISEDATITVPGSVSESAPANNIDSDDTLLAPSADFSVTKIVDNLTPNIGDTVFFTITLDTAGPSDTSGVILRDLLPDGFTYDATNSVIPAGTSYNPVTGDWVNGNLVSTAATRTLIIAASVNPTGTYTNIAQVIASSADDIDSVPDNDAPTEDDQDSVVVTPKFADLSITKIKDVTSPAEGNNITYTITVNNAGPSSAATGVTVQDRLPTGLSFVSAIIASSNADETATPCVNASGVVTCDLNTVDIGVDEVITLVASVDAGTEGTTLTNVAEIMTAVEYDPDSPLHGNDVLAEDDQISDDVTIFLPPYADLSLSKNVDVTDPEIDDTVTYTIVVNNAGPEDAATVEVSDSLPAGLTFVSAVVTGAVNGESCNSTALPLITCDLGDVVNAVPETITLVATVDSDQGGNTITNNAEITTSGNPDPDSTPANGVTDPVEDDYTSVDINVVPPGVPVSGNIYEDLDVNSFPSAIEDWSAGTTVFVNLIQAGTVIKTVTVNPGTGDYTLPEVEVGTYNIVITDSAINTVAASPSGWVFISPVNASIALTVADVPITGQNFGLYHGSTITGTVFQDDGLSTPTTGGIANDGVQNGSETGLGSVTVKLTDATVTSTVYATASTADSGDYIIYVPHTVPSSNLLITETNLSNYSSTAASVGNTAGAYTLANDSIAFSFTVASNYSGVDFADVQTNTFTNDGIKNVPGGGVATYPHVYTAYTDGSLLISASSIATPVNPNWVETIYDDANCDGVINPGEGLLVNPTVMTAGDQLCIVHEQAVPTQVTGVNGDYNTVSLTASFAYSNSTLVNDIVRIDVTTIGETQGDDLTLVKSVDKTTASPGDIITYTIAFSNTTNDTLNSVVINDTTPAFTSFISATCNPPLPNGISGCSITQSPAVGGTGSIEWTLTGSLLSAGSGSVEFQVQLDP